MLVSESSTFIAFDFVNAIRSAYGLGLSPFWGVSSMPAGMILSAITPICANNSERLGDAEPRINFIRLFVTEINTTF